MLLRGEGSRGGGDMGGGIEWGGGRGARMQGL